MKTDTAGYLPNEKENAQEHEHKFNITKAQDPNQLKAIKLREQVCDDPQLSDGAVRLFVRLLDMALNPFNNLGKRGQIIISQMKLASLLNCDERSIRRRVYELVATNYLWTTLVPRQNTKPMTCYHVTEFQPKRQLEMEVPQDGFWGNGKRRYDSGFARTGKAATGHQRRLGSKLVDQFGRPIFADLPENASVRGQKPPLSADNFDRSQRTELTSGSGQNCPVTEDASVRSQRSKLSGGSGQNCPVQEETGVRHIESRDVSISGFSESSSNVQRANALKRSPENEFLSEVKAILARRDAKEAELELANSGAWWRTRYRQDPEKADRVLREIERMIKEGDAFTKGPGACAVDLWQRFASKRGAAPAPARPARPAKPKRSVVPQQPSLEELLEGARYLLAEGKAHLLTKAQKQALERAK